MKLTQAFIFAAGRGERMRPLTDSIPKPLVKIKGKAIIDYTIEKFLRISSLEKIIINGFYLSEQVEEHIKNWREPRLVFSREKTKVETGGGLVVASRFIDFSKPLLCANGDVLWEDLDGESDVELMDKSYSSKPCEILLGLKKVENYAGYEGKGDFNLRGRILEKAAAPLSHAFVGLQIIDPKILQKAPSECFSMAHFFKAAVGADGALKGVEGVELAGRYFHIGTVDSIKKTEDIL